MIDNYLKNNIGALLEIYKKTDSFSDFISEIGYEDELQEGFLIYKDTQYIYDYMYSDGSLNESVDDMDVRLTECLNDVEQYTNAVLNETLQVPKKDIAASNIGSNAASAAVSSAANVIPTPEKPYLAKIGDAYKNMGSAIGRGFEKLKTAGVGGKVGTFLSNTISPYIPAIALPVALAAKGVYDIRNRIKVNKLKREIAANIANKKGNSLSKDDQDALNTYAKSSMLFKKHQFKKMNKNLKGFQLDMAYAKYKDKISKGRDLVNNYLGQNNVSTNNYNKIIKSGILPEKTLKGNNN